MGEQSNVRLVVETIQNRLRYNSQCSIEENDAARDGGNVPVMEFLCFHCCSRHVESPCRMSAPALFILLFLLIISELILVVPVLYNSPLRPAVRKYSLPNVLGGLIRGLK